jgi:hypothetical protein
MVNLRRLTDRAKDAVEKRGGTDALKDDMQELRTIAKSKGSLKEKAQAAKDALKDPGQRGAERTGAGTAADATTPPTPTSSADRTPPARPATEPDEPTPPADTPDSPRTK